MADFNGFITKTAALLFADTDDRAGFITSTAPLFFVDMADDRAGFITKTPGVLITAPASGGATGSPPVITFIDPLPGTPIKSNKVCVVDITDPDGDLTLVCVNAEFPNIEMDEVISRGLVFTPRYASSLVSPIANGYRFTLIRNEGWPDELRLHAEAADSTGNVT